MRNTAARRRSEGRSEGFSLIELMIALSILSFGILAMMAAQVASIRFSVDSRENTLAMKLAEQQMEAVMAMAPADLEAWTLAPGYPDDPGNPIDPDAQDANPMQFWRRTLVDLDTPEADVMTVTIEVDWVNALGDVRTAQLTSFKADP